MVQFGILATTLAYSRAAQRYFTKFEHRPDERTWDNLVAYLQPTVEGTIDRPMILATQLKHDQIEMRVGKTSGAGANNQLPAPCSTDFKPHYFLDPSLRV